MSSSTRTLAETLEAGFEAPDGPTPEEHDREEAARRAKMARAFRPLGADAPVVTPTPAPPSRPADPADG